MATLDQIYRAYLNEDPNVSQMVYDPHGWNYEQIFDDTVDDTTDTLPVTGGITNAYTGGDGVGEGYVPKYLPRDAEGFQIQPFRGSGTYSKQYTGQTMPDGTPIMSGYTEEEEDPNLLQRFGIGAKNFLGGITSAFPNMINRAIGRPADAIYSYPGDVTGLGSRAGITQEELRNMELLEQMGGINEKGQDIYGINVVSGFGDYTAYNKKRIAKLEDIVASQMKRGLKDTIQMKELEDRTGLQTGIESDEEETLDQIKLINKMKDETTLIPPIDTTATVADTAAMEDIISAPTGTMIGAGPLHGVTAPAAPKATMIGAGPLHGAGGGGGQAAADRAGGSWDYSPFRKGGRVRYGNGGIVDLL